MKKNKIINLLLAGLVICISSCKKEVGPENANADTFLKQYGEADGEINCFVGKTSYGYLMAGVVNTSDKLKITTCDKNGKIIWEQNIPVDRYSNLSQGLKLSDGSFMISDIDNPIITRITEDGKIKYTKWFDDSLTSDIFWYSPLLESSNGSVYVSYSGGPGTGGTNRNYISEIDPEYGFEKQFFQYRDSDFGGKIMKFTLAKVEGNTFWIIGNILDGKPWSWSDPWKLFTAKLSDDKVLDVVVYDGNDNAKQEESVAHIATVDNGLVLVTCEKGYMLSWQGDIKVPTSEFKVRKINTNLEDVWVKTINIGASSVLPYSAEEAENGDLIIVGTCIANNQNLESGFVTRLDKNGMVIASKIFNLGQAHGFRDALYLPDHSYFFTGYIQNFGNGKEQSAAFYLKTDKDFNY
jgi:hypothetical protein